MAPIASCGERQVWRSPLDNDPTSSMNGSTWTCTSKFAGTGPAALLPWGVLIAAPAHVGRLGTILPTAGAGQPAGLSNTGRG